MSAIINVFATRGDWGSLLSEVESTRPVHYAEAGVLDNPEPVVYRSASEIPSAGAGLATGAKRGVCLLMADVDVSFAVRTVRQKRGGARYAVDQQSNPDTVAVFLGRQVGDQTILSGSVGTCTESKASAALLRILASAIRRKWVGIKSYGVGPEAVRVLDAGGRLTANLRSPREYDLQR